MSSNVHDVVEVAVGYGVEHLDRRMVAGIVEAIKTTLRRRFIEQLLIATWMGYAN